MYIGQCLMGRIMWCDSPQEELSNLQPNFSPKELVICNYKMLFATQILVNYKWYLQLQKLVANDIFSFNDYDHL